MYVIRLLLLAAAGSGDEVALYDPDPQHLWNRLHSALFVRVAPDGTVVGQDRLDGFLCRGVVGDPERKAIELLDEFAAKKGEILIRDPIRRAFLQRDLWAVFDGADWHARHLHPKEDLKAYLERLRTKTAPLIRVLALTPEEIRALPDTFAAAVGSGKLEKDYSEDHPERTFLPPDLFKPESAWICLRGGQGNGLQAPDHTVSFGSRSAFLVFLRHPEGRAKGLELLAAINEAGRDVKDLSRFTLPPLPAGATLILVRQMLLIDARGEVVSTPVTESVQIRVHLGQAREKEFMSGSQQCLPQRTYELDLGRGRLFKESAEGLRAREPNERDLDLDFFQASRHLDFSNEDDRLVRNRSIRMAEVLKSCVRCHGYFASRINNGKDGSLQSVASVSRVRSGGSPLPLSAVLPEQQREATIRFKREQPDWRELTTLWK